MKDELNLSKETYEALQFIWKTTMSKYVWSNIYTSNVKNNSNIIVAAISMNPENNNKHKTLNFNV